MKIAAPHLLKRAGLGAAAVAVLFSATGCSMVGLNPVATAEVGYAPADGIVVEMGDLKATNMLLVAVDGSSPGRLLGSLSNNGDNPMTVTVDTGSDTARIPLPPFSTVLLEEAEPVILDPAGADPGLMVRTKFSAEGQTAEESLPVLDHTFPRYAEFVPGGAPSTPANPSNTPVPLDEMVGQEGGH